MGGIARDAKIGGTARPGEKTDFALYRAAFFRAGISPVEIGKMSLYELESMMRSFSKLDKTTDDPMTQDRMDELKGRWAALNLPDVKVH